MDSFRKRPGQLEKTLVEPVIRHADFFGKLFNGEKFSVMTNENISSHIIHLCFPGSPSAILGFIVAVVVLAVDGHAFWGFPHVLKEQNIIVPSFAYLDTTTTIVVIAGLVWIVATLSHILPDPVSSGFVCHSMRSGNRGYLSGGDLSLPTSTGSTYATSQLILAYNRFYAAFATTAEKTFPGMVGMVKGQNQPAIKFVPDNIRHGTEIVNKPFALVNRWCYHGF